MGHLQLPELICIGSTTFAWKQRLSTCVGMSAKDGAFHSNAVNFSFISKCTNAQTFKVVSHCFTVTCSLGVTPEQTVRLRSVTHLLPVLTYFRLHTCLMMVWAHCFNICAVCHCAFLFCISWWRHHFLLNYCWSQTNTTDLSLSPALIPLWPIICWYRKHHTALCL